MDGVIIDSNPYHKKAWLAFCKKYNLFLNEDELENKIFGRTGSEALVYLFGKEISKELSELYIAEINQNYRTLYEPFIKPLDGLVAFLDILKNENIKFAIATSAPFVNINFVLEKTGLTDYFKIIIDASKVKRGKPDPEIYLKTAAKLNTPAENCVVFEDSISGVNSAINAKMKVIGVTTTHTKEELTNTNFTINNFVNLNISSLNDLFNL